MAKIAKFEVKVHSTKDKKNLKQGVKEYEYGTINIRSPELKDYINKTVAVTIEDLNSKKEKKG